MTLVFFLIVIAFERLLSDSFISNAAVSFSPHSTVFNESSYVYRHGLEIHRNRIHRALGEAETPIGSTTQKKTYTLESDWESVLDHGSLRGFPTYNETSSFFDKLLLTYPTLIQRFIIGMSYENRTLYAYRLHNVTASIDYAQDRGAWNFLRNPVNVPYVFDTNHQRCAADGYSVDHGFGMVDLEYRLKDAKNTQYVRKRTAQEISFPSTLITALHHAREPASLTTVLNFVGRLLTSATGEFKNSTLERNQERVMARYILQHRDVVVIPFVNPDGYVAIETLNIFDLRKNRRPTCFYHSPVTYNHGVDLNRNYGFMFTKEHSICDFEEYEGEYPFSEPETQAIQCLTAVMSFNMAINFHSYGRLWTKPFNCCKGRLIPKVIDDVYRDIEKTLPGIPMRSAPEADQLQYETTGEADDWMLHERGIISMSAEVGPESYEFWPPVDKIREISSESYDPILSVIFKSGHEFFARINLQAPDEAQLYLINQGVSSVTSSDRGSVWVTIHFASRQPRTPVALSPIAMYNSLFVNRLPYPVGPRSTVGPIQVPLDFINKLRVNRTLSEALSPIICVVVPVEVAINRSGESYCHCSSLAQVNVDIRLIHVTSSFPLCQASVTSVARPSRASLKHSALSSASIHRLVLPLQRWKMSRISPTMFFVLVAVAEIFLSTMFLVSYCFILSDDPNSSTKHWFTRFAVSTTVTVSSLLCCFPFCLRHHRRLRRRWGEYLDSGSRYHSRHAAYTTV